MCDGGAYLVIKQMKTMMLEVVLSTFWDLFTEKLLTYARSDTQASWRERGLPARQIE